MRIQDISKSRLWDKKKCVCSSSFIKCDVYEILTNRHAYEIDSYPKVDCVENDLHCEGDPKLPPIGTRVRRGPNWSFTNQDSSVSGTVVGYRNDCKYSMIKNISGIHTVIMLLNSTYIYSLFCLNISYETSELKIIRLIL